jgi:CHAT domain-containing protein
LDGVRTYVGAEATESVLKDPTTGAAAVVHVASHAIVDPNSPLNTYIVLAAGGGEDGRLTAAEVEGLTLRNDLVVLSACATAAGSVLAGEGVEGLTAPLLSAGARSVVASRWDVEDEATARLMADFYEAMTSGLGVADALNAAKRQAMDRGEPPAVWAAFSVFGDPLASPSLRVRPPSRIVWLLMLGGLLVAGALISRSAFAQGSRRKVRTAD